MGTPKRPHDEMIYRRFRDALKRNPQPCAIDGCDRLADTVDHMPPLAAHDHLEGSACCVLRGVCAQHNYAAGGKLGRRRQLLRSRTSSVFMPSPPRNYPGPSRQW